MKVPHSRSKRSFTLPPGPVVWLTSVGLLLLVIGLTACRDNDGNKNQRVDNRNGSNTNCVLPPQQCILEQGCILYGATLSSGLDLGIDSSNHARGWLSREADSLKLSFPANQNWAAAFITVGKPSDPPHPFMDFSSYRSLAIEMRGESGGEQIEIGIKTNQQPNDGSEAKEAITLTAQPQTYSFPLARFERTDLKHLYVVTEFVYNGSKPQTIYVCKINYLR